MFILGVIIMGLGFLMVWRTRWFEDFFGSIQYAFGVAWLTWKMIGLIFLLVGFLLAFGLFGLFWERTIGGLFHLGPP